MMHAMDAHQSYLQHYAKERKETSLDDYTLDT